MSLSAEDLDNLADDPLWTAERVAATFDVTVDTVRIWIKTGKLRAMKIGKAYRIRRTDVLDFANERYNLNDDSEIPA